MKAAVRELWKRTERFGYGEWFGYVVRRQNWAYPAMPLAHRTKQIRKRLYGRLCLIADPEYAIRKIDDLLDVKETTGGLRVRILMEDVEGIDPAGFLYLCSRMRLLAANGGVRISGNYPRHPKAVRLLADADFDSFLLGPLARRKIPDDSQLDLIEGQELRFRTDMALRIKRFLQKRNPTLQLEELDNIYLAVMECLENVEAHAYVREDEDEEELAAKAGWYVVGLYDADTNTTSVAILDCGVGIIKSVTTKMNLFKKTFTKDVDLLEAATRGDLTESKDPKHGKGLRALREFAIKAPGRRLHVLSSARMVTWNNLEPDRPTTRKLPEFDGTIVCLEISSDAGATR